jgi:hypothetical protein
MLDGVKNAKERTNSDPIYPVHPPLVGDLAWGPVAMIGILSLEIAAGIFLLFFS